MGFFAEWWGAASRSWRAVRGLPPPGVLLPGIDLADGALGELRDEARDRTILYKVYAPASWEGRAPVVIFSHGLGGSREAAPYLGEAFARHGYVGLFIQHPGTDERVIEGAANFREVRQRLLAAQTDPQNAFERFSDLPFVLNELERLDRGGPTPGRLELRRVAMAGHSFGARGVMAAAGQRIGPLGPRYKEGRVRVGVALSPNLPAGAAAGGANPYDAVTIPILHVTGTQDGTPLDEEAFDVSQRTKPYEMIRAPGQALLVLEGATHGTFSARGIEAAGDDNIDPRHTEAVATAAVLFLDAHLKGDAAALRSFVEDFPKALAPGDRFETK